jgi:predicted O-methyltransferase YrrM
MKKKKALIADIEQFIIDAGSDSIPVFGGVYEGGAHIQQAPDELAPCIAGLLNSGETIRSILEIGSAAGGTTYVLHRFFAPDTMVIIDDNRHGKHTLRPEILASIERTEIIGNSRDQDVIDQARGPFDLIVIDGDHSYVGVKADVENYLPKLRDKGFLMFHDTAHRLWGCEVGVVVDELRGDARVELYGEYISPIHTCGIALFQKVAA